MSDLDIEGLKILAHEAWCIADGAGWHEKQVTFEGVTALLHSEVSEAFDEFRNGVNLGSIYYKTKAGEDTDQRYAEDGTPNKVEGPASELADIFIRICDHAEELQIPWIEAFVQKMEFNKTRSHRHGGKLL